MHSRTHTALAIAAAVAGFALVSVGGAAAVTVGRTILVPPVAIRRGSGHRPRFARDTLFVSESGWRRIILHERDHVLQRNRYGRLYLPLYVWWFTRYGYARHPLEN